MNKLLSLLLFILISLLSCNEKEALKKKLIGIYGFNEIVINEISHTSFKDNSLVLNEDNTCSVPRLMDDKSIGLGEIKGKWHVEINNGIDYIIIRGTRFEGKYILNFDEKKRKISLVSDKIIFKGFITL